jgi:hypothetical protein
VRCVLQFLRAGRPALEDAICLLDAGNHGRSTHPQVWSKQVQHGVHALSRFLP